MAAKMAKTIRMRPHTLRRVDCRVLEIKAKSEQEPPLIRELKIPDRLQRIKGAPVEKVLEFEEGEAPFVGKFPAQGQIKDNKGVIGLVSRDIAVLLHQKRPDPSATPGGAGRRVR